MNAAKTILSLSKSSFRNVRFPPKADIFNAAAQVRLPRYDCYQFARVWNSTKKATAAGNLRLRSWFSVGCGVHFIIKAASTASPRRWQTDVRFTPESGRVRRKPSCLLWAKSGHSIVSANWRWASPLRASANSEHYPLARQSSILSAASSQASANSKNSFLSAGLSAASASFRYSAACSR